MDAEPMRQPSGPLASSDALHGDDQVVRSLERPKTLTERVVRWATADTQAREHEVAARTVRRYRIRARSEARERARVSRLQATLLSDGLPADAVMLEARKQLKEIWRNMAIQSLPNRNPFHSDLEAAWKNKNKIDAIVAEARESKDLAQIPGLSDLMTAEMAMQTLGAEVCRLAQVAADDRFLTKESDDVDGATVTVVQHVSSGLRAQFIPCTEESSFGSIFSKPYNIASIDLDNKGNCPDWEVYVGLGIGTSIYRLGAKALPEIRWRTGDLTEFSSAVRRKLHHEDPYKWATYDCCWCKANLSQQWDVALPADFDGHS